MRAFRTAVLFSTTMLLGAVQPAFAQFYAQHNLVSDGAIAADLVDPDLVNAWGLVAGPTTPWWVANNGTATSTLYDGNTGAKRPLTVSVPGAPTGVVFNGGTGFVVAAGGASGPARFIFASEDGTISGWNPSVPAPGSTQAVVAANNSTSGAIYKGVAIASTPQGDFLYATNFHAGTVDVFDSTFAPVTVSGGFVDPRIPTGYAPFGIRNLDGVIVVTYALQDADKEDDVAGMGHGFVDAFDTSGHLLRRIASRGTLNSPWGLALSPRDFGKFSNSLLVGNFGDGRIHAYALPRGHDDDAFEPRGALRSADGSTLVIEGLWALSFGNGAAAGPTNQLFFTAGPFDEAHGLFGSLVPASGPGRRRGQDNGDGSD